MLTFFVVEGLKVCQERFEAMGTNQRVLKFAANSTCKEFNVF